MIDTRPIIEPAIMADEWETLVVQIEKIAKSATHIQIDVMDGVFVPSRSFPYNETAFDEQQIPYSDTINFGVHLMVQNPQIVRHQFIQAGVKRVVAQIEGFREGSASRIFNEWKQSGVQTGVALLLDTPLSVIDPLIENGDVSTVQVMSIARVGYQGEKFDERALVRIRDIRTRYPDVTIAVDGGVNRETLQSLLDAGANVFGIGSAIMQQENPEDVLKDFTNTYHAH